MMMVNILYLLLPWAVILVTAYQAPELPPRPYCGITGECCKERQDSCSHRILDTLCYCDEHCNRNHDDCCPDYEEVCLGLIPESPPEWTTTPELPPPEPQILLENCRVGDRRSEGCNTCTCSYTSTGNEWRCEDDQCIISEEVVALVNQGSTWQATSYPDLAGRKIKDGVVYKLGTFPLSATTQRMNPIRYTKEVQLPSEFDARREWPEYISPIMDQGWCGSDWAVTIAGVASDRFAIQSNGLESMQLSPQTLLSCNVRGQQGCDGGHIDVAWNFVGIQGIVDEDCFPYRGSKTPCPFKRRATLIEDGCTPLTPKRTERYKVGPPARLSRVEDIMIDIKESGPVHAIMTVYQDFFHYRSGIYRHTPFGDDRYHGLHSVRVLGWGEERGDKYWIVANSWGTQWGEDGYFRIARGANESGIESFIVTVLAEVTEA